MALIIGEQPYGKCDVVPELFYVATWFIHVDYFPLIPTKSRLVLGRQGQNYQVVAIPFSFKSLFWAWSRTGLLIATIVSGIWAISEFSDRRMVGSSAAIATLVAVFCAILYAFAMIYPRRHMPSYARACRLAQIAQLDERGWAALNVLYGRDPLDRPGQEDVLNLR